MESLFNIISNNTNEITLSDLTIFLRSIHEDITDDNILDIFTEIDINDDNVIDLDEFSLFIGDETITDSDLENIMNNLSNIYNYLNILKIEPLHNHTLNEYANLITKIIGDDINILSEIINTN